MEQVKRYRLLKDLPYAAAGSEYTQENNDKNYYNTNGNFYYNRIHCDVLEHTPEWFELIPEPLPDGSVKEERVTIGCLKETKKYGVKEYWYEFVLIGEPITQDQRSKVQQAIERVLNNDNEWIEKQCQQMVKDMFSKEISKAEEKAFNAAREEWVGHSGVEDKYRDYDDYRKSLTENAEPSTPSPLPLFTEAEIANAIRSINEGAKGRDTKDYLYRWLSKEVQIKTEKLKQ